MNRSMVATVALAALTGCGIENGVSLPLPDYPLSHPPELEDQTWTDTILQVTTPKVDILWMVDNSCSMSDNQALLTQNVPSFMNYFVGSGLDYHVGVTSSDIISSNYPGSDGTLVLINGSRYIDPDAPNPVGMFIAMAELGTTGKFPERGVGATYLALTTRRDTTNAGFYRDDASLHTIIISDEPDYTKSSTVTQPEYLDWYEGLKPDVDERTFSAVIDPHRGTAYKNLAEQIGGIVWDINSQNWDQVLDQLGLQAAGLSREYFLSHLPVAGSIQVSVQDPAGILLKFKEAVIDPDTGTYVDSDGDGTPDGDWTYDTNRNSITFLSYVPTAQAEVIVTYTLLAAQHGVADQGS